MIIQTVLLKVGEVKFVIMKFIRILVFCITLLTLIAVNSSEVCLDVLKCTSDCQAKGFKYGMCAPVIGMIDCYCIN